MYWVFLHNKVVRFTHLRLVLFLLCSSLSRLPYYILTLVPPFVRPSSITVSSVQFPQREIDPDFCPLEVPDLNSLRWVSWNSTPIQEVPKLVAYNQHLQPDLLQDVIVGRAMADPSKLAFRDLHHFLAGQLHKSLKPGFLSPRRRIVIRLKKFLVGLKMASMFSNIFSVFVGPSNFQRRKF